MATGNIGSFGIWVTGFPVHCHVVIMEDQVQLVRNRFFQLEDLIGLPCISEEIGSFLLVVGVPACGDLDIGLCLGGDLLGPDGVIASVLLVLTGKELAVLSDSDGHILGKVNVSREGLNIGSTGHDHCRLRGVIDTEGALHSGMGHIDGATGHDRFCMLAVVVDALCGRIIITPVIRVGMGNKATLHVDLAGDTLLGLRTYI